MEVFVAGAANSAGQAAVHLSRFASRVVILARGRSLSTSMSEYLRREIEATPNISVMTHVEIVDGRGSGRLEQLTLRDTRSGDSREVRAEALFVLIGAVPFTDWLSRRAGCPRAGRCSGLRSPSRPASPGSLPRAMCVGDR